MLSREQVRRVDRLAVEQFCMPSIVLMENAGRGVAEAMSSLDIDGPVVLLCGPGNNGGDGLVIARHLDILGYDVELFSSSPAERWQGDAQTNYKIVAANGQSVQCCEELETDSELREQLDSSFENAAWIVDCLLGTGATGAVRAPADTMIRLANESGARRLAVDVPSGLDCDTGESTDPTFEADHTCTLVAKKPGLVEKAAAAFVGELHVIDIGVPRALIELVSERVS